MMEENPENEMRIPNVLHPIFTPRISGEMIRPRGKTTDESTSLGFGLAFEGGLIAVVSVHVDGVGVGGLILA